MINAFLAAFTNAVETVLDRTIMTKEKVTFIAMMSLNMFFVFMLTTALFPYLGTVDLQAFTFEYLFPFGIMIAVAFAYNYLYYYSLKHEKIVELEPLIMTHSLFAVLLAALVFPSERNVMIFVLAIIASVALILSRVKKHHLQFNKFALSMLGFAFLFAVETLFLKKLLLVYSPLALYVFRTGILSLLFFIFLRPKLKKLNKLNVASIFGTALIVSIQYVALYFAIANIGLVRTALMWALSPFLVFVFSMAFLKEKMLPKQIAADIVILACVVASALV